MTRIGPARRYILLTAVVGAATAVLILMQALLLARMLAPVLSPTPLVEGALGWWGWWVPLETRELATGLSWLLAVVAARAVLTWFQERLAHRAGTQVISELRSQVVAHAARMGPRWAASGRGTDVTTLTTRGLDNMLPYFVRYLPQLLLAATVTPLMLVVVLGLDWLSALIVVGTLPLVPIFMVLVGLLTRERSARHLESMQRLSSHTLDLIAGLPTLRALGRHRGPAARVRDLGEAHQRATMGSLRIAFLSGMVLELLTTLAVALVAVTMGFRLVDGAIGIEVALAVLVLAPEVYLPLRNVGTHFHASADGLAAADQAFAILDEPLPAGAEVEDAELSSEHSKSPADAHSADADSADFASANGDSTPARGLFWHGVTLEVDSLGVATPHGARLAPGGLSFTAAPGQITVLEGPNGDGKTTALLALIGLMPPDQGQVRATWPDGTRRVLASAALSDTGDEGQHHNSPEQDDWTQQCAWVPQRPDLGPAGRELSLGQRHLRALDRALESGRPLVILDEPTAHLDQASRAQVIERIRQAARDGATVVVATHEDEVRAAADVRVTVTSLPVDTQPPLMTESTHDGQGTP
ncbi:MAG: ABC transporter transmembrane domain-containing protein [Demequina sp.]